MYDLFLRADTETQMMELLRDNGLACTETDDDGNTIERVGGEPPTSVCVIGIMQRQTSTTTDDEGNETPVYSDMPGWHVNVRTRDPVIAEALCCMEAEPATPSVRWAGPDGQRMKRPVAETPVNEAEPQPSESEAEPVTDTGGTPEPEEPPENEPEPTPEAVQTVLDTKPNLLGGTNITKLLKELSDSELQMALSLETRPLVRTLMQTQLTLRGLL